MKSVLQHGGHAGELGRRDESDRAVVARRGILLEPRVVAEERPLGVDRDGAGTEVQPIPPQIGQQTL